MEFHCPGIFSGMSSGAGFGVGMGICPKAHDDGSTFVFGWELTQVLFKCSCE